MAMVARTMCVLMLALGFYLIGATVFSLSDEVFRLVFGFLMAGAGYQLWVRVERVESRKKGSP